ncbi:unnamed protein product [Mytilus coruscus]|uniref:Uncharacterized protein n=1 Tax=Mytilus coruscus TaxID=42192 RepID=A0A6J8AH87_MYTCO|nr:unnamed protein product [Mytilus coruscus]
MNQSAQYQHIQRDVRNNMPPQSRPAEFSRNSERQPDNCHRHHNRTNHATSQIQPRFHRVNMHQNSEVLNNQATQNCSNVYQSSTQEAQNRKDSLDNPSGAPLFISPGDIPCNKISANLNLQDSQQQAKPLPTSNYSLSATMSTVKTMQDCLSTPVRATSHQAKSDKSFLGVDQINPPPDPGIVKNTQIQQNKKIRKTQWKK